MAAASAPTKPTSVPPTLEQLARLVGEPDEQLRQALFKRVPEGTLVEHGTRGRLAAHPRRCARVRAGGARWTQAPSARAARAREAAAGAVCAADRRGPDARAAAGRPRGDAGGGGGRTRSEREAGLRAAMRAGLALRSVTVSALRNVLGREGMAPIEAAVGTGDTASKLAHGLEELGRQVRRRIGADPVDRYLFNAFGLDEACAAQLDEAAARVRKLDEAPAPPDRVVTQRMLDLQDGRVLHLIAMVLRAFRAAHKADGAVPEPDLPTIGWLFDARSTRRPAAG